MATEEWKPVFDYLEQETRFQAAASGLTGAVAAWWLKALLFPAKDVAPPAHLTESKVAALLFAVSAILFLVEQGRLARWYGELARYVARGTTVPPLWTETLVRNVYSPAVWRNWSAYYAARLTLMLGGAFAVLALF